MKAAFHVLVAIMFFVIGAGTYFHPVRRIRASHMFVTDHPWVWKVCFGAGIMMLVEAAYLGLTEEEGKDRNSEIYVICPVCETVQRKQKSEDGFCTTCRVPMEPLSGFYERHPEMKDEDDLESAMQSAGFEKRPDKISEGSEWNRGSLKGGDV